MATMLLHIHQVGAIVKELFGKEPSRGVNPDEVVAMGAAIQVPSPEPILHALHPVLMPKHLQNSLGGGAAMRLISRQLSVLRTDHSSISCNCIKSQQHLTRLRHGCRAAC
jgi:Hsp70 protein